MSAVSGCIKPLPDSIRQRMDDMFYAGASDTEVERTVGVSRTTAFRRRRKLGLPVPPRTACRRGHPYPQNQGRDSKGRPYCVPCAQDREKRRTRVYVPVEPDEAAIERAVYGDTPVRLSPRERRQAIVRLGRRGFSAAEIADRLGCSTRTVFRVRRRVGGAL